MSSAFSRFITRTLSILKGRKGSTYTVSVHPDGIDLKWFALEEEPGERSVRWEEISSVTVYKRDLHTSDMICLLCTLSDGVQFEFNEEMPCWQSLVDALPQYLPGCPVSSEWWQPVAVPAFATNETVIFRRNSDDLSSNHG